jgi:SagB-type dehydrogenase family enzyme
VSDESAASLFHRLSSFGWFDEPAPAVGASAAPPPLSPEAPEEGHLGSFVSVLAARSSRRDFDGRSLSRDELLVLLWSGCGLTGTARATVPSAGGLLSLRLTVLALRVTGLVAGVYAFTPDVLSLDHRADPPEPRKLFRTHHIPYERAGAVIFVSGAPALPLHRYGERGYRYALLEAGHIGQNLCLAATAMGLGAVPVGGFDDDEVNRAFTLEAAGEVAYYAVAVGGVGRSMPSGEVATVLGRLSGIAERADG